MTQRIHGKRQRTLSVLERRMRFNAPYRCRSIDTLFTSLISIPVGRAPYSPGQVPWVHHPSGHVRATSRTQVSGAELKKLV